MNEQVKDLTVRLINSTGGAANIAWFDDTDAWEFVLHLIQAGREGLILPQMTVTIGLELAGALGLAPGAPERSYLPALERQYGPCPHHPDLIIELVRYVRGQINGVFEGYSDGKNRLLGESKGPRTVYGNLDFS